MERRLVYILATFQTLVRCHFLPHTQTTQQMEAETTDSRKGRAYFKNNAIRICLRAI